MYKKLIIVFIAVLFIVMSYEIIVSKEPKNEFASKQYEEINKNDTQNSISDINNNVIANLTEEAKIDEEKIEDNKEEITIKETEKNKTSEEKNNKNIKTEQKEEKNNASSVNKDSKTQKEVKQVEEKKQVVEKQTEKQSLPKENTTEEKPKEETKSEKEENCTNINNHFMPVGNSKKWFNTKEEAISLYDKTIKEWGDKWVNNEIDSDKYYANCPYRI